MCFTQLIDYKPSFYTVVVVDVDDQPTIGALALLGFVRLSSANPGYRWTVTLQSTISFDLRGVE
jgi:hypothetical protein